MCVLLPTAIGLVLGEVLRRAEAQGSLERFHYLKDQPAESPAIVVARYGTRSWASQAPALPDLYVQEVWPADADGTVRAEVFESGGGSASWLDGDTIARIEVL